MGYSLILEECGPCNINIVSGLNLIILNFSLTQKGRRLAHSSDNASSRPMDACQPEIELSLSEGWIRLVELKQFIEEKNINYTLDENDRFEQSICELEFHIVKCTR